MGVTGTGVGVAGAEGGAGVGVGASGTSVGLATGIAVGGVQAKTIVKARVSVISLRQLCFISEPPGKRWQLGV